MEFEPETQYSKSRRKSTRKNHAAVSVQYRRVTDTQTQGP